ncbi:murein L,D-transpeptidase YafK [Methylovorus glucosotrophus]|uniref:L,D-transpeptidase Cds6 family protein n=1 Tax=Methylovorus glucosotrophus TaxID=266009 RepID=UPI0013311899|nr:L,D-transpeptidase family protein [Methylovorus glucosotrophus]KAF0843268.1 murein L,D-transpeptidase YafK [Methylovorus glucosotrophus]
MNTIKTFLQILLMASIMVPWNVPALDRLDYTGTLSNSSFGPNYPESLVVKGLLQITRGQLQQALNTVDELISIAPNFKLAYLIRGDLLMAKSQQLEGFGNTPQNNPSSVEDFKAEARMRIERYLESHAPQGIPEPLWQIDPTQKYVIVVDADKSRLYLYQNIGGKPTYVADYYVTIGRNGSEKSSEGDKRTPLGVYTASSKLTSKLPDFYGRAAYPLSYPNEWDRQQGKKGHGIWLHGTPSNTYSRPPRASDGCVVISNPDLETLGPILQQGGTPFIIVSQLKWVTQAAPEQPQLQKALDQWRQDWQAQDTDRYLSHYSDRFFSQTSDINGWSREKRRIQSDKKPVSIVLSNISMIRYPNSQIPMAVVSFDQEFKSEFLDSRMRKRQYWIYEGQRWKILYEGAA